MDFLTLDNIEVSGRTVLVRVDINCPVDKGTGRISAGERIEGHAQTIKELADKGARVVVLAHQGRKGDYDFIPLEQHSRMLSGYVGRNVKYVPDLFGKDARNAVKALKDGEVLVLENTRFFDGETEEKSPEEQAKHPMVLGLAPLADYFVLDAFSAAHRSHVSIVGFAKAMKAVAGRVMQREVTSIAKAIQNPKKPCVFVVGGAKPEDSMAIMGVWLERGVMDKALIGGVMANVMLLSEGRDIGPLSKRFLESKGYLDLVPKAKEMLEKHNGKIVLPLDVAVDKGGSREDVDVGSLRGQGEIKDIGEKTSRAYAQEIANAGTVIINGPMGVSEEKEFENGTREVLEAIAESKAFSLAGGGHTIAAIDRFGVKGRIGYVSLAGKAFMKSLLGKKLIGVEVLKESASGN